MVNYKRIIDLFGQENQENLVSCVYLIEKQDI